LSRRLRMTLSIHFDETPGGLAKAISVTATADLLDDNLKIVAEIGFSDFWTMGEKYTWGCTRADVTIGLDSGRARDWVRFATARVSHKLGTISKRSWTGQLKPEASAEAGAAKTSATVGSVSRTSEREVADQIDFAADEATITDVRVQGPDGIKWNFMLPQGQKAYRSWIVGTFGLWSTWDEPSVRRGWVRVRYNMAAFDSNRRQLSRIRRWLMEWRISKEDAQAVRDMASADRTLKFRFDQ
jgi:hypothetical protein